MPLDPILVEVLACPVDKGPLWFIEDAQLLYNPRLRKVYPVNDGIPDLLIEDSTDAGDADHQRFTGLAEAGQVVVTATAARAEAGEDTGGAP